MTPETPKPNSVERETPAEREAAYADFRSGLTERLIAHDERTVTYVDVRQLVEQLDDGGVGYIEAEMSEDSRSGDPKLDKVSFLVPDDETGDYQHGKVLFEAPLPYGEVRKFVQRKNLSPAEVERETVRAGAGRHMMVATESTVQLARADILKDKPEGYEGEPATAAEVRQLLGRLPKAR